MRTQVFLGFTVGAGEAVQLPIAHMAVTGQTQASGKTTTLEALISRAGMRALAFITKRGESAFDNAHQVRPYFRDRADWQFVTSIIDATLQEKNKFLRPWIMKICRHTETLADVQAAVRKALVKAKGINEGVYTQLDAYLDLIVPEIRRARLATSLQLADNLNVMDLSDYATPMQMLFVQSAIDEINAHARDTIVVIPEAWEFIPEGKGSPVKASAVALARKGAALRNFIWIDSQDMAGVDKTLLRACTVWLIGVQREANEIKRNLANIPAGIAHPKAVDVAHLGRGQFFACWEKHVERTYVQPAWMPIAAAHRIAMGLLTIDDWAHQVGTVTGRKAVDEKEARALRDENAELKSQISGLRAQLAALQDRVDLAPAAGSTSAPTIRRAGIDPGPIEPTPPPTTVRHFDGDFEHLYAAIKARAAADPGVLQLLQDRPEIVVKIQRHTIETDGATTDGRIAKLLADGFYDEGRTNSATRSELKRTGPDVNNANIDRILSKLLRLGFVTLEGGNYRAVAGMKVNIVEA